MSCFVNNLPYGSCTYFTYLRRARDSLHHCCYKMPASNTTFKRRKSCEYSSGAQIKKDLGVFLGPKELVSKHETLEISIGPRFDFRVFLYM